MKQKTVDDEIYSASANPGLCLNSLDWPSITFHRITDKNFSCQPRQIWALDHNNVGQQEKHIDIPSRTTCSLLQVMRYCFWFVSSFLQIKGRSGEAQPLGGGASRLGSSPRNFMKRPMRLSVTLREGLKTHHLSQLLLLAFDFFKLQIKDSVSSG